MDVADCGLVVDISGGVLVVFFDDVAFVAFCVVVIVSGVLNSVTIVFVVVKIAAIVGFTVLSGVELIDEIPFAADKDEKNIKITQQFRILVI